MIVRHVAAKPRARLICLRAVVGCAALLVAAQLGMSAQINLPSPSDATPPPLQFDTVSVKPDKGGDGAMFRIMSQPDGYSVTANLKLFLSFAYGMREDLISGAPGWVDGARYEIDAKVASPDLDAFRKLSSQQRNRMLQSVLVDRFKLKAHMETRELAVYELVVAKGGPKLQEAKQSETDANGTLGVEGAPHRNMMRMSTGRFIGQAVRLSLLVEVLSRELHRNIIDKTGLTGEYDITLKYTPDDGPAPMLNGEPDTSAPSIFTALEEQLGLKLNPAKGPVEMLMVDHIEPPSEN
jgi:uncharacterized protein (TIGR03435 family)